MRRMNLRINSCLPAGTARLNCFKREFILGLLVTVLFCIPSYAADPTGKLTVFSDVPEVDIFVDGIWAAKNKLSQDLPLGKHYVRVAKGEETIQSGIVDIESGKEKIIVAQMKEQKTLPSRRLLMFCGNYSGVTYAPGPATLQGQPVTYNLKYDPSYGIGSELIFYIPNIDLSANFGFTYNLTSKVSGTATWGTASTTVETLSDAQVGISYPYINITKNLVFTPAYEVGIGAGLNWALYSSPGRVTGSFGYQAYIEVILKNLWKNLVIAKLGWIQHNGRTDYPVDISNAGIFGKLGIAYEL